MILNINSSKAKSRIGYLQSNKTNEKQKITSPIKQHPSPNFKSAELSGFMNYFAADVAAIIVGCGIVDAYFKKTAQKESKDFGLRVIKRNHKKDFAQIKNLTTEIVNNLKQNKSTGKIADKIKKTYEKTFKTSLIIKESTQSNITIKESLDKLYDIVDNLFIKMDNKDSYIAIGKPFLHMLEKADKKLEKLGIDKIISIQSNEQKVKSVKTTIKIESSSK